MARPKKPKAEATVSIGLRCPPDLLARLDAEIERFYEETGVRLNQSQAVIAMMRLGLDVREKKSGGK